MTLNRSWTRTICTAIRSWRGRLFTSSKWRMRGARQRRKPEQKFQNEPQNGRDVLTIEQRKVSYNQLAGGPGFEPRLTESESAVLPLNYPPPKHLKNKSFFGGFTNPGRKFYKSAWLRPLYRATGPV